MCFLFGQQQNALLVGQKDQYIFQMKVMLCHRLSEPDIIQMQRLQIVGIHMPVDQDGASSGGD